MQYLKITILIKADKKSYVDGSSIKDYLDDCSYDYPVDYVIEECVTTEPIFKAAVES